MLESNLFQQAKDVVNNVVNGQDSMNENDKQAAQNAIKAAYQSASPEEQQHLAQLEQQLEENNLLS